tara:strand:- start:21561 stop:21995 length:435 start_codon:yes stop_codon:yes gene_type:complete
MKRKNKVSVIFPKKKNLGKRKWGKEILLALVPKVLSFKLLKMKKGAKGGLQYHHKKNECGYIISGKLKLRYVNKSNKLYHKILKKGDVFHFPPGSIHQEEAITNCQIIEASTPHFNDRVRVEKLFGIKDTSGLKTTKKSDVKFL